MLDIIHLDDHRLFREGFLKSVIRQYFPNTNLYEFDNGDNAEHFILNRLQTGKKLDLIISDINHSGVQGDYSVPSREWERNLLKGLKTPTLIFSMRERQATQKFLQNCGYSYLHKSCEPRIIVEVIEDLLYL